MTCSHCGHQNPNENRFCGMCGVALLPASEAPLRASEAPPRATEPEPAPPPPPRREPEPASVSGPSFLGLSSEPNESGSYSYLFQDDPEPSHRGLYVLLLLLVIAAGVAYARWQPIRQFVMNKAGDRLQPLMARLQKAPTPAPAPQTPPPAPASADQANITVANSQPELPAAATPPASQTAAGEPQRPQAQTPPAAAEPKKPEPAEEKPSRPAAKSAAKPEAEADEAAADNETPAPVARRARPQPPAGDALVSTGEKYLYGRGVRKNCNQAVTYFRAAAEQHNPRALSRLGTMYAIGECVPLDRAVAYSWFGRALAVDRSNRSLERNMSMLWREMSPEERQRAGGR